jgi:hypothetical protein
VFTGRATLFAMSAKVPQILGAVSKHRCFNMAKLPELLKRLK